MRAGRAVSAVDRAAVEEPLEIRLHGQPFAVTMRTPGADLELAAGFLLAEGILASPADLGAIESCRDAAPEGNGGATKGAPNVVNAILSADAAWRVEYALSGKRHVAVTSACGICGRRTIESLKLHARPVVTGQQIDARVVANLPQKLRVAQPVFDETGGLHAAGLFTLDGDLITAAEDVGRHNAVDKVIGHMVLQDEIPLSQFALFVSGRTSFEIVQKAVVAGIPVVGAVSAPSSLAIELAQEMGVTLIGFVRDGDFNVYAHEYRIGHRHTSPATTLRPSE
jgi:FdhD protein